MTVNNNATISGTGTIGTLSVTNGATVGNGLTVTAGATALGGALSVTGTSTFTALSTFNGGVTVANNSNFSQTGTGTFDTGTGIVHLNGNTSVTTTNTFTTGSGAVKLGSLTNGGLGGVIQSDGTGLLSAGTLTVPNGGTGNTSFATNGILFGNGAGNISVATTTNNGILATGATGIPQLTQFLPPAVQANITNTGILIVGSIASGFGTISTANNITTSATVQGNILNASGVGASIQLGGADINTAGTLSNVAYINKANTFTLANTFNQTVAFGNTTTHTGLGTFSGGVTVDNGSNFIQTGTGSFSTGTGGAIFYGNTSISGTNTFTTGTGAVKLGSLTNGGLGGVVQSDGTGLLSSGTVTVANGGTGVTTLLQNGILYGNNAAAVQVTGIANNSILTTGIAGVPILAQILPAVVQGNITTTGILGAGSINWAGSINTSSSVTAATLSSGAGNFGVSATGAVTIATFGTADPLNNFLCRNSTNIISSCSGGTPFVQGGNSFTAAAELGTNDAYVLNFKTGGTNRLQLDTVGNITLQQSTTIDITTGVTTPTIGIGTGNARIINLGNNNSTMVDTFTAGAYGLKVNNTGVNITSVTSSGADLTLGDATNSGARTINVVQASSGAGGSLTIQAGAGATGTTVGGNLVLQGGAKGSTGTTAGIVVAKANGTDGIAFQVQNNAGSFILSTNTSTQIVTIGGGTQNFTTGTGTGDLYVTGTAGVSGLVLIGTVTNGASFDAANHQLSLIGTARRATTDTLVPEYAGATLTGNGGTNIGTMSSDFCSNTGALSIATGVCSTSGDVHNYYSWTTNQPGAEDYDIYVRYQVPSDFGILPTTGASLTLNGWVTSTASSDAVQLAVFKGGAACGSAVSAATTAGVWTTGSIIYTGFGGCSIGAGDLLTFQVHVKAGATGDFARAGEITFSYLSQY